MNVHVNDELMMMMERDKEEDNGEARERDEEIS